MGSNPISDTFLNLDYKSKYNGYFANNKQFKFIMENKDEIKRIFKLLCSKDNELFMLGSSLISKILNVVSFEEYIKKNHSLDIYFISKRTYYIFYLYDELKKQKGFKNYKGLLESLIKQK